MIHVNIKRRLDARGRQQLHVVRQLPSGSIIKITGPSGAGKTTFLKIIAGLANPEQGVISVEGTVWLDTEKKVNLPPQKRRVGFVFQDYALFPNMTVIEHLQYATDDKIWIARLLLAGELEEIKSLKPAHLSGGQQQRLAIFRALAIKPKLLLMDEPFSALDRRTKAALINELNTLFTELGITVIIVSHNMHELEAFAGESFVIGE